jgi:hypothetical protein
MRSQPLGRALDPSFVRSTRRRGTSNAKADGRFGKQDFRYVAEEDVYICPAGERLVYHFTSEENGLVLHRTFGCR